MNMLTLWSMMVLVGAAVGHGRLASPPSRSSAWKFGFGTPINHNDWVLNCGEYEVSDAMLLV